MLLWWSSIFSNRSTAASRSAEICCARKSTADNPKGQYSKNKVKTYNSVITKEPSEKILSL